MKNTYLLVSLAASLLFGGAAAAQMSTRTTAPRTPASNGISASVDDSAKSPDLPEAVDNPTPIGDATLDHETLAQLARRRPGAQYPSRGGYPGRGYPSAWNSAGNARHTLIGLAIGFGLGAALGAKGNKDQHPGAEVRAAVLFGAFGGLIGAAIGHGAPPFYARNGRHHRESSADEEASNSGLGSTQQTTGSEQPAATLNADRDALLAEAP
jgi:hypothetical protein